MPSDPAKLDLRAGNQLPPAGGLAIDGSSSPTAEQSVELCRRILSADEWWVLELCESRGLSPTECASALGASRERVGRLLRRALRKRAAARSIGL